jgi:acetyl-CoA synthetase
VRIDEGRPSAADEEPATLSSSHDSSATSGFLAARDLLHTLWDEHDAAVARFAWPAPERFNWALDWFDQVAVDNTRIALRLIDADSDAGTTDAVSYAELSESSNRVANWLRRNGLRRGQQVLLMLDTQIAVWEIMLAAMKLGAVVIPVPTTVSPVDLINVLRRTEIACVVTADRHADLFSPLAPRTIRVCVGEKIAGWLHYANAYAERRVFVPSGDTNADDLLFVYLTSGTTARPKMVCHTHTSYPIGSLSGMYWSGLLPGDVHLDTAVPGQAVHAWSSLFGPFNAEATVVSVKHSAEGAPSTLLGVLEQQRVSSLCAAPATWEVLLQHDLGSRPKSLREACSIGAPLSFDVIEKVRAAWGVTVRDGYGQTETTPQIGMTVGLPGRPGAMGKPLPGYPVALIDPHTGEPSSEGEVCIELARRPAGLMSGYFRDAETTAGRFVDGYYHTGDLARRDSEGYLTYESRIENASGPVNSIEGD